MWIRCDYLSKKGRQPIFSNNCQDSFSLPFQRTWLFIYCRTMPGHWKTFLTWACCAVTLLTLRLGSGLYGNGDGESVLPSERNKLTKPVDCGENWPVEQLHRGTHRGPRLILLPPACRSTTATSLIGTHPKNTTLKGKKNCSSFNS